MNPECLIGFVRAGRWAFNMAYLIVAEDCTGPDGVDRYHVEMFPGRPFDLEGPEARDFRASFAEELARTRGNPPPGTPVRAESVPLPGSADG